MNYSKIIITALSLVSSLLSQTTSFLPPDTAWSYSIKYGNKTSSSFNAGTSLNCVAKINSTMYVGVGSTKRSLSGPFGAMFVSVDSIGKHLWDTVYTVDSSYAGSIQKLTDTSFIAFGSTRNMLHIWKISINGSLLWDTIYQQVVSGLVRSTTLHQTNYLIACENGIAVATSNLSLQYIALKSTTSAIRPMPDGYMVAGQNYDSTIITKLDNSLAIIRRNKIVYNVNLSQNPGLIMNVVNYTGFTNDNRLFSVGSNDLFARKNGSSALLQTDTNCSPLLYNNFSSFGWEMGWYAFPENDSEIVTTGETSTDCYIRKVAVKTGTLLWEKKLNVSGYERIKYVVTTNDGGYIACGDISDYPNEKNGGLLIKFKAPQILHAKAQFTCGNTKYSRVTSSVVPVGYIINSQSNKNIRLRLNGQVLDMSTLIDRFGNHNG